MRPLVLACLFLAAPLRAEPACAPATGRGLAPVAPVVARHIDDLDRLIARGRRNGWLTPGEMQRLRDATHVSSAPVQAPLSADADCALRDLARRAEVLMRQDVVQGGASLHDGSLMGSGQTPSGAPRLR